MLPPLALTGMSSLCGGGGIHRLNRLCWQFPGSSSRDGSGVGGALNGVPLVGGGSAVAPEEVVVKT